MMTFGTLLSVAALVACINTTTLEVRAEEKKSEKSEKKAPEQAESSAKKRMVMPFNAKVVTVNKTANTIGLGKRTFHFTPKTEITKDGKTATINEAKVGEIASGSYKDTGERLELLKIRFGPKPTPETLQPVSNETSKKQ
jgi:hypothetical protein